jgi:hypothetical protein
MPSPYSIRGVKHEPSAPAREPAEEVRELIDVVSPDGRVRWMNDCQRAALGYAEGALDGAAIETLYAPESAAWVRAALLAAAPRAGELTMLRRDGRGLRLLAESRPSGDGRLTIFKQPLGTVAARLEQLETENRLLRRIADAGNEAHWCIEFEEPIELALPIDEIVHRVFTAPSFWRFVNQAMSRQYGLPRDVDMRGQSVRLYWPRSPENEAFVRHIIAADYCVDGLRSLDRQHDGTVIEVENDVRADIEDGWLRRLWGKCRLIG